MKARITGMPGIDMPIICGGMIRFVIAEFVAAVSKTGDLGFMPGLSQSTLDGHAA